MQLQELEMQMFGKDAPSVTVKTARENSWCSVSKFEEHLTENDIRNRRYPIEWETKLIANEKSWD